MINFYVRVTKIVNPLTNYFIGLTTRCLGCTTLSKEGKKAHKFVLADAQGGREGQLGTLYQIFESQVCLQIPNRLSRHPQRNSDVSWVETLREGRASLPGILDC